MRLVFESCFTFSLRSNVGGAEQHHSSRLCHIRQDVDLQSAMKERVCVSLKPTTANGYDPLISLRPIFGKVTVFLSTSISRTTTQHRSLNRKKCLRRRMWQ